MAIPLTNSLNLAIFVPLSMSVEDDHHKENNAEKSDLTMLKSCPVCGAGYDHEHMRTLMQQSGAQLLLVTCATCQSAVKLLVVALPQGITTMGVLTDLQMQDIFRIGERKPFSQDDVLAWHSFIQSPKSFSTLWRKKR